MNDFKNELEGFAQRLKNKEQSTPMQEVKPVKQTSNKEIIRTTVHLPADIHHKIKMHCVKNGISFKDFVTEKLISSIET